MSRHDRVTAAGVAVLAFVAYAWFFGGGGWNQNASFDVTRAIAEDHTFHIDRYVANTRDVSSHNGHFYSNKAPGICFLALPIYAAGLFLDRRADLGPGTFAASTLNMYLCTVFVCGATGAALVGLFFLYARRLGFSISIALSGALMIAFGTYIFAYATVFYSHVPSALFLFWAWTRRDSPIVAGALGGLAVFCNYTALLPLIVIMVAVAVESRAALARMVLGGLPFAIALCAYQAICFGSPFHTAIDAEGPGFKTQGALYGVFVRPQLDALFGITFSRYRGLFFLSPILLLAFAGAIVMLRKRVFLKDLAVASGVFASLVLMTVCFNTWKGGENIGPRYILAVVPFLAIPMMFALQFWRWLAGALAVVSFVFNFAVTAVNPQTSRVIRDPIFAYTLPLLITGHVPKGAQDSEYAWANMEGHVSVNRLSADEAYAFSRHPQGSLESEWASFNLGELFWPGSPRSLAPIALWIVGGTLWLFRRAKADPMPGHNGLPKEPQGAA